MRKKALRSIIEKAESKGQKDQVESLPQIKRKFAQPSHLVIIDKSIKQKNGSLPELLTQSKALFLSFLCPKVKCNMAANSFFGYTAHSQATPAAAGYNAGVAPPPPTGYPTAAAAAAGVAVTPSVAVAAQPPQVPAGSVAANQFVAHSQPTAPPPQPPPQAPPFRPGTAVIALTAYQHQAGINPATYVMAPPTASAAPVVTPTSVYPTSTYHPYPPPATPVAAAAGPVQVYDAISKPSYYAQPPVRLTVSLILSFFQKKLRLNNLNDLFDF